MPAKTRVYVAILVQCWKVEPFWATPCPAAVISVAYGAENRDITMKLSDNFGRLAIAALTMCTASMEVCGDAVETLSSPTGGTVVTVTIAPAQAVAGRVAPVSFSIQFAGQDVLVNSPFNLEFKGAGPLTNRVAVRNVVRASGDETWQRLYGKRKQVRNRFNELAFELEETAGLKRRFTLLFRAYDDGVAFRYLLPADWGRFELAAEETLFCFPTDATVWAADFGGFKSPQEAEFKQMRLSQLLANKVYGCPLLVKLGDALWAALTEADLTDWAGVYFRPVQGVSNAVRTVLAPLPEDKTVAVRSVAPRQSPWRVIMIGERPGTLIESDILENLNPPPDQDFSWVKPGKAAWNWWSAGYAPELDFKLEMDTRSMKYFIDFAAEMGWEYMIVDEGWYGPAFAPGTRAPHPTSSITKPVPELDLQELIAYAKAKGVRLILWLHWAHVDKEMDVAFPLYEKWGVAGVKVDFMDRDDQEMVNFYERVARKAAQHHLLVNFHGAFKPTGWHRTYPNVITREGVLGNEYNKWSARITPEHTVTIPFTRGMLGGMDFTPGGFRQKTPSTFRAVGGDKPGPFVMGTRVHQLAMLIVYESALQVLCDSPYSYRSSPAGLDFLKIVPTTWDDTKVLNGDVGEYITVARRSGDEWYIGSMTGAEARSLEIPLSFLGPGKYEAEIWADAYEAADYPDRLMKQKHVVTASDTLTATMAEGGGYIARLRPLR